MAGNQWTLLTLPAGGSSEVAVAAVALAKRHQKSSRSRYSVKGRD